MAHECPECGDDICFGEAEHHCNHCEKDEDDEHEYFGGIDDYEEEMQERDEQRMSECKCGGYQKGADGKIIMVADCVC